MSRRSDWQARVRLRRSTETAPDTPGPDVVIDSCAAAPTRSRFRRLARRTAIRVLILAVALTAASFGYNSVTDRAPARPTDLRFAVGGGFVTRYRSWGTSGPPIVLVPGAFETADTFTRLGDVLGTGHRVFAIDLTGTGYSDPNPPFDAAHLAVQLLAFLDAQGLTGDDAPLLVGHSSGAAVVGRAAMGHPQRVRGVVFLDGDALPLPSAAVGRYLVPNPFRTSLLRLGLSSNWLIRQLYSSQCGPQCPSLSAREVDTWRRPLLQPGFTTQIGYTADHGIPSMTSEELNTLKATPIAKLVVYGSDDPQLAVQDACDTATRIGAPPPIAVPGRHLPMISSPHQVADAILSLSHQAEPSSSSSDATR